MAETYIRHVGNVLDQLVQDKDPHLASQAFNSPNPLPLDFVDASTPRYIQTVDASLQRAVQKIFRLEQELTYYRKYHKSLHPVNTPTTPATIPSSNCSPTSTMAISTPPEPIPCGDCILKSALVASNVAMGNLKVRIDCRNRACNRSVLVVSINEMITKLSRFSGEVIRVVTQGVEGKLGAQAKIEGECGVWKELVQNLNIMTDGHTKQIREITTVCTAIKYGDLSQKITVDVKGEALVLKGSMNKMVEQLRSFSSEVTRVVHEVGVEGKLGGRAQVEDVSGSWKELTDNVNMLATNLTTQIRDITSITTGLTRGDLRYTISVETRGEISQLKRTINSLIEQLRITATMQHLR
ncbi:hypothetical protein BGZ65_001568 [Modicella reniformis]|uniref:HAMP domain-containing protein n=1 Tax=Modicella reniformis TaxID=1440133 RepID=A0A9P6ILR5_9FUNG|nr:hypothetical protein BGZ65_001568 [Modicella reniformis]